MIAHKVVENGSFRKWVDRSIGVVIIMLLAALIGRDRMVVDRQIAELKKETEVAAEVRVNNAERLAVVESQLSDIKESLKKQDAKLDRVLAEVKK